MASESRAPTRPYRGTSAADRCAQRREQLLAAGLDLLGTVGTAGTTVRGVCERAKLTPRYFYESFPDLDALLVAVFDRIVAEATSELLAAYAQAPDDAYAKARASIETAVRFLTEDPRRARVAFIEALGSEALTRRRLDTMHGLAQLLAAQAREFYGAPADADPIADVAAGLLVGGITELLITWLDGRLAMTREQLVDDFTELFVATGESAVAIARRRARKGRRRSG
jgi:AcrR family transcriptional regulator